MAKQATQEEFVAQLPEYQAKVSKDFPEFLLVTCPYDDCPGTANDRPFLVHKRTWMRPVKLASNRTGRAYHVVGRSCPYCFRTGRLPKPGSLR